MRRHAVLASAALLVPAVLAATPSAPSSAAVVADRDAPSPSAAAGSVDVRLPTGQRVVVSKVDGRTAVRFPASTAASRQPMSVLTANGHTYVLPARMPASAGRKLDLAAYDVSARAFGQPPAALGRSSAEATPADPFTVTLKGITRTGGPASGDVVVLMNADDTGIFIDNTQFSGGVASFVVPAGHYLAASVIVTVKKGVASYTMVTDPEFVVDQDVTRTLDARDGNRVTVHTPRASTPVHAEVNMQRDPATGLSFVDSLTTFDNTPVYATPTDPVHVGRLYFYQTQRRGAPGGSIAKYLYDLEIASKRVVPTDLKSVVTTDDLATVTASYASAVPGRAEQESRLGGYPWQGSISGGLQDLSAPTTRTEYVMARPHLRWYQEVDLDPAGGGGRTIGSVDIFRAGEQTEHVWDQQPMGSGVEQQRHAVQGCPVCRTADDTLSVAVFPHVDKAGDFMLADGATSELLTLYQDGAEVGSARGGFATFPMSPDPASYRLQYDVDHTAPWWPTSTHVSTSWSFASAAGGTQVPPGWSCGGKGALPDDCFLQHLLLLHWATGAGLDGVVPAGTTAHVRVSVAPQYGLPADPVSKLTAKVSYDGGATWQQVTASQIGTGKVWRLTYQQPPLGQTDGFASLQVTAKAASGDAAVSQTIIHAYPVAPLG